MRRGKGKRALAGLLAAALCAGLFFLPASAAPEGATVWGYSEGLAQCELAGKWGYVDAGRNVESLSSTTASCPSSSASRRSTSTASSG